MAIFFNISLSSLKCDNQGGDKVCQQYDVFSQSWGFMQSTAEGSRDHRQMGSQKGNSDVIFTNSSQCARRITLPVCTTEVSGDWSLVWSIILEERRRRGKKRKADNISQGNTVLRIKELPQAKQNHDKSLNPGHTHFLKTVGCYDIERVK